MVREDGQRNHRYLRRSFASVVSAVRYRMHRGASAHLHRVCNRTRTYARECVVTHAPGEESHSSPDSRRGQLGMEEKWLFSSSSSSSSCLLSAISAAARRWTSFSLSVAEFRFVQYFPPRATSSALHLLKGERSCRQKKATPNESRESNSCPLIFQLFSYSAPRKIPFLTRWIEGVP